MSKILVTGATGSFGKAAISHLIKLGVKPSEIKGLVRDEAKATELKKQGINLAIGEYDNYTSLVEAFMGIDKLLFVSASDIPKRTKQHINVIKAAIEAGVNHVYYTSFQRVNETNSSPIAMVSEAHLESEKLMKNSKLTYTVMRNNLYMDVIPMFIGDKVLETETIYQPGENGKSGFVWRDEMAEGAAKLLTEKGHENKVYDFSSTESYSYADIADMISQITGKKITYVSPTPEEFHKTLSTAGVPEEYIGLFSAFSQAIAQNEFEKTSSDLEHILGRKLTDLKSYLTKIYTN